MPEFRPPTTINDLRQILQSYVKPSLLSRCLIWMMGLFSREIRESFRENPEVRRGFNRMIGVIDSMTPEERAAPELVNFNRESRIARGSGTRPNEVRHVLQWYFVNRRAVREREERRDSKT